MYSPGADQSFTPLEHANCFIGSAAASGAKRSSRPKNDKRGANGASALAKGSISQCLQDNRLSRGGQAEAIVYLTLWGNVIGIIRQRANRSRRWCIGGRREELAFRWPRRLTLAAWHSWHAAAFPCLWRSGSIAASIAVLQSSAPEVRPPRLHRSFKSSCDNAELNDHESQRHCRNKNEEYAVSCALRFLLQQGASLAASCVGIPYCMPRVVTASLSDRQNCRVTFRDKFQQLLIYAS